MQISMPDYHARNVMLKECQARNAISMPDYIMISNGCWPSTLARQDRGCDRRSNTPTSADEYYFQAEVRPEGDGDREIFGFKFGS